VYSVLSTTLRLGDILRPPARLLYMICPENGHKATGNEFTARICCELACLFLLHGLISATIWRSYGFLSGLFSSAAEVDLASGTSK
jgi:hypothetical protein